MPIATKSSRINISKESKTKSIAEIFAKNLISGNILLISGELGVGKTTFVKYLINSHLLCIVLINRTCNIFLWK